MSKDDFEYHAHAAGASSNMAEGSGLFVEGVAVPADTAAVFSETACAFAVRLIRMALDEDGPDLTSLGIFPPEEEASAYIVAKQRTLVVGLPLISLVLAVTGMPSDAWHAEVREGDLVENGVGGEQLLSHLLGSHLDLKVDVVALQYFAEISTFATKHSISSAKGLSAPHEASYDEIIFSEFHG